MAKNREYRVYRDFEPNDFYVGTATTSAHESSLPWDWNIMVHRHFDPLGDLKANTYNRRLKMRIVFGIDGAWLSWRELPSTYLALVKYVPRLDKIAKRHFRYAMLEYLVVMSDAELACRLSYRRNQFIINGRGNYEYCSEESMSHLIPDAIIAMRAFSELYSMTEREYKQAVKSHKQDLKRHPLL